MSIKNEIGEQVAKAAPPVVIAAGSAVPGITLNEWVFIATLIYIVIQAVILIRKEIRNTKREEREREAQERGEREVCGEREDE